MDLLIQSDLFKPTKLLEDGTGTTPESMAAKFNTGTSRLPPTMQYKHCSILIISTLIWELRRKEKYSSYSYNDSLCTCIGFLFLFSFVFSLSRKHSNGSKHDSSVRRREIVCGIIPCIHSRRVVLKRSQKNCRHCGGMKKLKGVKQRR